MIYLIESRRDDGFFDRNEIVAVIESPGGRNLPELWVTFRKECKQAAKGRFTIEALALAADQLGIAESSWRRRHLWSALPIFIAWLVQRWDFRHVTYTVWGEDE